MKCIVIFGIQGSGKGIQAKLLSQKLGYQHINIGDLLRDQISRETEIGKQVHSVISRGELVADELVFHLVDETVDKSAPGIVFDGFPRTRPQVEYLRTHYDVQKAFFLRLEEDVAIARILSRRVCQNCGENYNIISKKPAVDGVCDICGGVVDVRMDDRPEAIQKRVHEFYMQTKKQKLYFAQYGLLKIVSADQEPQEVFAAILAELNIS